MRRLFLALAFLAMFVGTGDAALAQHRSSIPRAPSSSGSSSKIHVNGYTRKDGTHVAPYERRLPGTATKEGRPRAATRSFVPRTAAVRISYAHYATGYVGARDENGRIVRSEAAKRAFETMTGYPHGRPGYVVDHVIALKHGGVDAPSNMQWQTIDDAKAKDKWE